MNNSWLKPYTPPDYKYWFLEGFKDGQKALAKKVIILIATIGALLLIVGCSTMPEIKVEGIDNLKITEHVLSTKEVTSICGERLGIPPFMRFLVKIWGCATVELESWTCTIFYSMENLEEQTELLEHERLHCQGYWHDEGLQQYYDEWRKTQHE